MTELRLEIDRLRLDEEWINQPALYWTWAKKAADAQLAYDHAKSELSVEQAEIDLDIRNHPDNYGLADVKITENVISSTLANNKIVKALGKKVREAKHDLDVANAAVNAIEHRKRALSMLVELWIREYYADPHSSASTSDGDEWRKRSARTSGRMRREQEEANVGARND